MTSTTHKPHEAPAGDVEVQLIVIIGGKLMVNNTKTIPYGCYRLDVAIIPNEDCKPAAEDFTGPGYAAHPGHDHEDCCK